MPNFLQETTEILARNGKTLNDIRRVCGDDFQITVDDFIAHANFEYNNGFGAQEVAHDLKVVGDDWWLERSEYDGAERWNFKTLPNFNLPFRKIETLARRYGTDDLGWSSLAELNYKDDNYD